MKTVRIEFHSHSKYSHDCGTTIENIANVCRKIGLTHIVICDHDNYGKSDTDISVLAKSGVILLPAIEFTTKEGVHIVGIHPKIHLLQALPLQYGALELVKLLKSKGAYISIPHPYHTTGLIGNGRISDIDIDYCLSEATFIEVSNYKYGDVKNLEDFSKYEHLTKIVGSDAHSSLDIGAHYVSFEVPEGCENVLDYMVHNHIDINFNYRKKHGRFFWIMKKAKRSSIYQFVLNIFSRDLRRDIKNKIFNK